MEKEKILSKVQHEENKEYEDFMNNKILTRGVLLLIVIAAVIFIIRVIHAEVYDLERATSSDSLILIAGLTCYVQFCTYFQNKKRESLFIAISMLLLFLSFFIQFLMNLFGQ